MSVVVVRSERGGLFYAALIQMHPDRRNRGRRSPARVSVLGRRAPVPSPPRLRAVPKGPPECRCCGHRRNPSEGHEDECRIPRTLCSPSRSPHVTVFVYLIPLAGGAADASAIAKVAPAIFILVVAVVGWFAHQAVSDAEAAGVDRGRRPIARTPGGWIVGTRGPVQARRITNVVRRRSGRLIAPEIAGDDH